MISTNEVIHIEIDPEDESYSATFNFVNKDRAISVLEDIVDKLQRQDMPGCEFHTDEES